MQEYARQLRREREQHSWSQEQVAEKLGTTAPNVSRWERGKTFPDTYYCQKLCELFGKSPQELGLLQNEADKKREQSSTHPAVTQDSNAPVLGESISLRNRNRQRMLAKVQAYWISGVLEQSLHIEAIIALGLHEQPGAIADPWTLMLNQQDQPVRLLPPGKSISQVYDEMGGELLILGEPDSGETTLLLMLTSDLLDRARKDETHPVPVVFNLSSWATRRQPLSAWLNEELHSKYQVPRKLAKAWIENEAVLPLLDGLDEVSLVHRVACVEAINRYRQEHGLVPMVICSRSNDYFVQAQRVLLRGAVVVQPLTEQQIEDYLLSGGEQLTVVRVALDQDAELQALATIPLMLSVLTLAYAGVPVEAVLDLNSSTTRQRQVFAIYVQRMLQHRGTRARYTPQQIIRWLTYLAQQLAAHHQTELYLERIQPNWLSIGRLRKFHASPLFRLALGLVVGLIGGVLYGLICGVVMALVEAIVNQRYTGVPVLTGWWNSSISQVGLILRDGLLFGLIIGLVIGVIGRLDSEIRPTEVLVWSWTGRGWRHVIYGLVGLLSGGFIAGASASWFELLHDQVFALSGNDVSVFAHVSMLSGPLVSGPVGVLIVGLVGGLVGLFLSGWSSTLLDKRVLIKPNQGIRRSARRGALTGLISAIIGVLVIALAFTVNIGPGLEATEVIEGAVIGPFVGPWSASPGSDAPFKQPDAALKQFEQTQNQVDAQMSSQINAQINAQRLAQIDLSIAIYLAVGITCGWAFTLYSGGFACIKHLVLRVFLWLSKSIPWKYARFLDAAADLLLLRKVGGGYIFMHQLLLEYFASLDD